MDKNVKQNLVKETANFLECDLNVAEKQADEWVKKCKNFYEVETKKQSKKVVKEIDRLMDLEELEGEQYLKDLFVNAERTVTKEVNQYVP